MRRAYYLLRGVAYTLGVASVLMILWGRRSDAGFAQELMQAGVLLVALTLVLFTISYVLFGIMHRRRIKPRS
jgi:hypothetical protein